MATKQEIINDIRSLWPNAGVLNKANTKVYIQKTGHNPSDFLADLDKRKVKIDNGYGYLVIDIADKLYRSTGGAS